MNPPHRQSRRDPMFASRKLFTLAALMAVAVAAIVASAQAATAPPSNTSAPQVAGPPRQGSTFTAYPGTWTNSPTSYSYSWIRLDANANNRVALGIHRPKHTLTDNDV